MDRWARGAGPLHRLNPKAKVMILLTYLIAVSTTPSGELVTLAAFAGIVFIALVRSGLPLPGLMLRAAITLPFSISFALLSYLANGEGRAAAGVLLRGQLCVLGTLLVVATTPLPILLRALESFGIPTAMLEIAQFIHRYLFVIADQGQRMRWASASRDAGKLRSKQSLLQRTGGAVGVLFACSYARAEGIHRATVARGPKGGFPVLNSPPLRKPDIFAAACYVLAILGVRLAAFN